MIRSAVCVRGLHVRLVVHESLRYRSGIESEIHWQITGDRHFEAAARASASDIRAKKPQPGISLADGVFPIERAPQTTTNQPVKATILHDEGSGPALLYVPGVDGGGDLLLETAERLRERFRLVQIRYTHSETSERGVIADLAASLISVLDDLKIDKPLLLAESFGGPVVLTCALANPDRIRGMAIVNSFPYYPRRVSVALSNLSSRFVPPALFEFMRPRIAKRKFFGRLCEPDALDRFQREAKTPFDVEYRARIAAIPGFDVRDRLSEIHMPISLFAAECDRVVPSVACGELMHASLPNSTLTTIPEGGHVVLPLRSLPWVEWLADLDERANSQAE